jgi:hypothetical protein
LAELNPLAAFNPLAELRPFAAFKPLALLKPLSVDTYPEAIVVTGGVSVDCAELASDCRSWQPTKADVSPKDAPIHPILLSVCLSMVPLLR